MDKQITRRIKNVPMQDKGFSL